MVFIQFQTRNTLSIIQKELEEAKRLIEAKVNSGQHGDNVSTSEKQSSDKTFHFNTFNMRTSETDPKEPFIPPQDEGPRPANRSEKVYARYVQEGDRNLMLIYEPKDSKSEIYVKQIGNKNVVVHLNMSSNICQLIDPVNKGIIPLDSEGEGRIYFYVHHHYMYTSSIIINNNTVAEWFSIQRW